MDVVLIVLVVSAMQPLALCLVVVPPAVIVSLRRRVVPAVLLYLAALSLLYPWVAAANAHMDWADRTGGQGNALAGAGWFLGALAAAAGAVALTTVRGRSQPAA